MTTTLKDRFGKTYWSIDGGEYQDGMYYYKHQFTERGEEFIQGDLVASEVKEIVEEVVEKKASKKTVKEEVVTEEVKADDVKVEEEKVETK
jgi:hypothetical protein